MKRSLLASCSLLGAALSLGAFSQNAEAAPARAFQGYNFSGYSVLLYEGNHQVMAGSLYGIRAVNSLVVPMGTRVQACAAGGVGVNRCSTLTPGRYANLSLHIGGPAFFLRVNERAFNPNPYPPQPYPPQPMPPRGGVTVYEDSYFGGTWQVFGVGNFMANRGQFSGVGNDRISSLVVSPGFTVKACSSEGYGWGAGLCRTFGPGRYASLSFILNDAISYLEVRRTWGY